MENTMPQNDPTEKNDEMEFDDVDQLPTDNTDIEESEYATTDAAPADLIDLIADEKASEARSAIFRTLYSKIGDKIDGMKSDFRNTTPQQD